MSLKASLFDSIIPLTFPFTGTSIKACVISHYLSVFVRIHSYLVMHSLLLAGWILWHHRCILLLAFPGVEEIIMEDKLLSCINSWDTLVNNNHPLQPEEDAEPLCKDAEPTTQAQMRTQSPWEDAEPLGGRRPPGRTQSHLKGRRAQPRTQSLNLELIDSR